MIYHKSKPEISGCAKFAGRNGVSAISSAGVVAQDSTPRAERKA
jgi:hypothetical protein